MNFNSLPVSRRYRRRLDDLPSRFQLGDSILASGQARVVTGVMFAAEPRKIWYQADGKWWPSDEVDEP